ncbi:hypothetical protein niasHT_024525 [Heterodera trifolii]|uniref:Glycosyltransferase family 92 protein n=1 Tax=Heterodera trifolii TaxID=157864 RepID=A0ABD2K795_9BILA
MKAYEREGLLRVRPGIRFPHQRGMPWDPNAETEFNGQILLAHDCFYEYRHSAQFIGLIDWDDLLVPSRHFATLPEAFAAASAAHPDTAYFLVNKLEASFEEQLVTKPSRFSLRKVLRHGIRIAQMYNDEKMVVRPTQLRGFWMHNSFLLESGKRPVKLYTNYSILLHLANEERVLPSEFQTPFMANYDIDGIHLHASTLLKNLDKQAKSRAAHQLPSAQPFYAALVACHSRIFAYYKSTGVNKSRCLSYSLCVLPEVPQALCAITRNTFGTLMTKGARTAIHANFQRPKVFFFVSPPRNGPILGRGAESFHSRNKMTTTKRTTTQKMTLPRAMGPGGRSVFKRREVGEGHQLQFNQQQQNQK